MIEQTGARDGANFNKVLVEKAARPADAGETLITMINGIQETSNVLDGTEMVITGPAGEEYAVAGHKFGTLYEEISYGIYRTKPETVVAVMINDDMVFEAPWGGDMIAEPGDFIIWRSDTDAYRVERSVFQQTYELAFG